MVCNLRHANTALFTSAGEEKNKESFKTACEWCLSEQPAWAPKKTVMNHINILFSRLTDNKLRN